MRGRKQENRMHLEAILDRAVSGRAPDDGEIRFLLSLSDEEGLSALFAAAREVRSRFFGNRVFMYGFLYFNTFCRNDCLFCRYRRSNTALKRYRKSPSEVMETAEAMAGAGVHLIDLTSGEYPDSLSRGGKGAEALVELVREIKRRSGLPVMVSPGVVSKGILEDLASAGADWYACYQETHNRRLFSRLRIGQSYDERMGRKRLARNLGMLIEEGILVGAGESLEDAADSIFEMRRLDADQVRVMTFVPQENTPMAVLRPPDVRRELVLIAVLRLAFPDRLIPASLDIDGLKGLEKRLEAGANVVTSLIVPGQGLAGVAAAALDIEQARRTPETIMPFLERCGLEAASPDAYRKWVDQRRSEFTPSLPRREIAYG